MFGAIGRVDRSDKSGLVEHVDQSFALRLRVCTKGHQNAGYIGLILHIGYAVHPVIPVLWQDICDHVIDRIRLLQSQNYEEFTSRLGCAD